MSMRLGRRIAFDYGQVRIGVAVSDQTGLIATPIATLKNGDEGLKGALEDLFQEYEPIYIVVGEPRHLSGALSQTMSKMSEFLELLSSLTQAPLHLVDERMSTLSAARTLRDRGHNAKSSKDKIDAMAAVAILESALHRERVVGSLD
jgi:putative Holliday junction resolvase